MSSWFYKLPLRLRALFRRKQVETDLESEMAFHLEMQAKLNRESGMNDKAAWEAARRQFGGVTQIEEECRDMRRLGWLEDLWMDVRQSLRSLRKTPGFVLIAVVSLALGIGANSALFSVVDAVLLHSLPLPQAERLFLITEQKRGKDATSNPPRMYDWQARLTSLEAISGSYGETLALTTANGTESMDVRRTAGDILGVWGTQPIRGRAFTREEQRGEGPSVALLTFETWKSRFGGRDSIVGESLTLSGSNFLVIGVLPAGGAYPTGGDLIAPMPLTTQHVNRRAGFLNALARWKPGVSKAQAQAELDTVAAQLAIAYPDSDRGLTARFIGLQDELTRPAMEQLPVLAGTMGLILLLACVNLAALLTARGMQRRREAAVRVALGAGRGRLIRLFLTESLCVALAGCAAGLLLADAGIKVLLRLLPEELPNAATAHVNMTVVLFAIAAAIICGIAAGAAPAWAVSREAIAAGLKEGGAGTSGVRRQGLLGAFVIGEVALSMMLLVGAGLLGQTLIRLSTQPLGFRPEQTLAVSIYFPWNTPAARLNAFHRDVLEKFSALPGVRAVGMIDRLPLEGGSQGGHFTLRDVPLSPDAATESISLRATSPGYFAAMGIPLVEGEGLAARLPDAPKMTVVNQAFARKYFEGRGAVGQFISFNQPSPDEKTTTWWRIAGIVPDVRQEAAKAAPPEAYILAEDTYWPQATFVIRGQSDARELAAAAREAVRQINPNQLIQRVRTLEDSVYSANATPRLRSELLGGFAAVALFLAAIGVYGILAQEVVRRSQEFGVRLALGANPSSIGGIALRRGLWLAGSGITIGVAGAFACSRYLETYLYGVTPTDGPTFLIAVGVLLMAAIVATYLPARRASRVDPLVALRHE